jgi:hypothetical protein
MTDADSHRGGCDVVEVYIADTERNVLLVDTVEVAGLLTLSDPGCARISVKSALYGVPNPIIRDCCARRLAWNLWLRSGDNLNRTFRRPPPDQLWPTDPDSDMAQKLKASAITFAVVLVEEDCVGAWECDGAQAHSVVMDGAGFGGVGIRRTTSSEPWVGDLKRAPLGTSNASGAPACRVRAVLFTGNRRDSFLQLEADLLYQRGLVLSVVCPTSIQDMANCLDTVRPGVVIVSAAHCGQCGRNVWYACCDSLK